MNKRLALLLLLLCGLVHADDSAEKERLKKQREAIEAEHAQREKVCHQQFVVNSCLEKARIDRQKALQTVRTQELALEDAERRERAQAQAERLEKKAQAAAFAAAKPGVACEVVDAAARKVITDAGFGPDYKVPGLPHRTGHGIGLDGHEWTNFVRGNKTPMAPGMCFSDEPMIAIYGEFGIRLEDCLYITEGGAKYFSQPSPSIDKPFA
jgi:hypothetical protein